MSAECPAAIDGLDIHEVEDGLVVYDARSDRVHYLNATAAVVLSLCDGTKTDEQLAGVVCSAWSLDDPPIDDVRSCLAQLRREGVVG
jgi:hypothetical protein